MTIHYFEWDEGNETHIERRRVKPEEAEEVLLGRCFVRRSHSGRYVAFGTSLGEKLLVVAFERLKDNGIRVITARPMDKKEKKSFRRLMG